MLEWKSTKYSKP